MVGDMEGLFGIGGVFNFLMENENSRIVIPNIAPK
jgi:hypothetical protein